MEPPRPTLDQTEVLLRQYAMLDQRRDHYASAFWRLPPLAISIITAFAGLASSTFVGSIKPFARAAAFLFVILGLLFLRLWEWEDKCEARMTEIETRLPAAGTGVCTSPVKFAPSLHPSSDHRPQHDFYHD
jgi:hypothetical protein